MCHLLCSCRVSLTAVAEMIQVPVYYPHALDATLSQNTEVPAPLRVAPRVGVVLILDVCPQVDHNSSSEQEHWQALIASCHTVSRSVCMALVQALCWEIEQYYTKAPSPLIEAQSDLGVSLAAISSPT